MADSQSQQQHLQPFIPPPRPAGDSDTIELGRPSSDYWHRSPVPEPYFLTDGNYSPPPISLSNDWDNNWDDYDWSGGLNLEPATPQELDGHTEFDESSAEPQSPVFDELELDPYPGLFIPPTESSSSTDSDDDDVSAQSLHSDHSLVGPNSPQQAANVVYPWHWTMPPGPSPQTWGGPDTFPS